MSEQVNIEIQEMAEVHVDAISELTYQLPNFAKYVSFFGLNFLKQIYIKNIVQMAHSFGYVAQVNGDFAGFIVIAYPLAQYYDSLLKGNRFKAMKFLIGGFFRSPITFLQLLYIKAFLKGYVDEVESEVALVAIKPEYVALKNSEGNKISTIFMNKVIEDCKEKGIQSMKTETPSINEQAKNFYKKYGFEEVGEVKFNREKRTVLKLKF